VSEPGQNTPIDYASGWVLVDFLLVTLVWWLVVRSAIYFRRK